MRQICIMPSSDVWPCSCAFLGRVMQQSHLHFQNGLSFSTWVAKMQSTPKVTCGVSRLQTVASTKHGPSVSLHLLAFLSLIRGISHAHSDQPKWVEMSIPQNETFIVSSSSVWWISTIHPHELPQIASVQWWCTNAVSGAGHIHSFMLSIPWDSTQD